MASAARPWSMEPGCSREMLDAPPTSLLVVGARKSEDQGPAGSSRRPSGEHIGGGDCQVGEEIGPPPPSPLSSDTTLSDGKLSNGREGMRIP